MGSLFDNVGRFIARLQQPVKCQPFAPNDMTALRETLRPGDVLLVEGKGRISGSIKYLTQSAWSHSALYVGPMVGTETEAEPHVLIEANIEEGVVSAPLSKYLHCRTRICRPVGLTQADCETVCRYASERIGLGYDFKNVIDLMRYLFPGPAAQRWRRRTITLGSGDASRIICSSLIAQAFDAVRYPILPEMKRVEGQRGRREVAEIRHSSFYRHAISIFRPTSWSSSPRSRAASITKTCIGPILPKFTRRRSRSLQRSKVIAMRRPSTPNVPSARSSRHRTSSSSPIYRHCATMLGDELKGASMSANRFARRAHTNPSTVVPVPPRASVRTTTQFERCKEGIEI